MQYYTLGNAKIGVVDKDAYKAWTVSSTFGLDRSYHVYMELYALRSKLPHRESNYFYERHLKYSAEEGRKIRTLESFSPGDLGNRGYELARMGFWPKKNVPGIEPHKKITTNTGINWDMINVKTVAYLFAKGLLNYVLEKNPKVRDNCKVNIDLGCQCVESAGKKAGTGSIIQIEAKLVSPLKGANQVSFKLFHTDGIPLKS